MLDFLDVNNVKPLCYNFPNTTIQTHGNQPPPIADDSIKVLTFVCTRRDRLRMTQVKLSEN